MNEADRLPENRAHSGNGGGGGGGGVDGEVGGGGGGGGGGGDGGGGGGKSGTLSCGRPLDETAVSAGREVSDLDISYGILVMAY